MTGPQNSPYRRRLPDPAGWPSNVFSRYAAEATRRRVNELSWSLAGEDLAGEIEQVLSGAQLMPPQRRPMRLGEPGE